MRFTLHTHQGPTLEARLKDLNGPAEVFGAGEYSDSLVDWSGVNYVMDVGAHVGGFALWTASRSDCRVVSLEPDPDVRRILESNVRRQGWGDRILVLPWALAGGRGSRSLRPAADSTATMFASDTAQGDLEVETIGLSDAIAAAAFPRVDLLKIDIEGAEYEVFAALEPEGLLSVAVCVIECHPVPGASIDSILEKLKAAGFAVTTTVKPNDLVLVTARRVAGEIAG